MTGICIASIQSLDLNFDLARQNPKGKAIRNTNAAKTIVDIMIEIERVKVEYLI